VLDPILFILYTIDLIHIVEQHGFRPHLYADDMQVHGSCTTTLVDDFQLRLSACVNNAARWMSSNRLQLNTDKTELIWCTTARRLDQLPSAPIRIGPDHIEPSSAVHNPGIFLDSGLAMRSLVQRTVAVALPSSVNYAVSVGRSPQQNTRHSSMCWCCLNSAMAVQHWPAYQYGRLQSVLNYAA
jgi:hypothetical protein